ncbi:MAG TPA: histidine kinase N-terminal 7TM domain-containing protein [Methanoculleus sp.]|nr:histidine kinase N-terminal 7TM domain-containing protein [Methanoculleus sp.]
MILALLIGLLFLAGGVLIALMLYCYKHRDIALARPLGLLLLCAAFLPITHALNLMTETLWLKIFLLQIRFLAVPFLAVFQLIFILTYLRREEWIQGWKKVSLFIIPIMTVILAQTTWFHPLYRYDYWVDLSGPLPILNFTNGIGFQVHVAYSHILLIASLLLLIFVQPEIHAFYRRQRLLLLAALLLPLLCDLQYQLNLTPYPGLTLTPFALMFTGLVFVGATLRQGLLEVAPVARGKVIEEMSSPMLVIDARGRMTDMNTAAVRLLGTVHDDAIGSPADLVLAGHPSVLALAQGASGDNREIAIGEGLERQFFDVAVDDLRTGTGAVIGKLVLLQNITERKQAEEALKESEEKYRTIIENMQDLFYRTDLDGTITMISPSGAALAGYGSPEEMIGVTMQELYADPLERERFLVALRANGAVGGYPLVLKMKDGTLKHVTVNGHFFTDAEGSVRGVEGIIHDVTDLHLAEQALRQANRQINLMSSITRHDILNQLTVLLGNLSFAQEEVSEGPLSGYLEKMSIAAGTIQRQIEFTRDYQDLGVRAPEWQRVSGAIRTAAAGGLPITDETDGLAIYADPMLVKVFANLMDNTIRHAESATRVHLRYRPEENGDLTLVWEDDGVGVPAGEKERIFDRGFGKNTGLGLFLIREILAITGITIAERGEPGEGARFEMRVPSRAFRFGSEAV